MENPPGNIHSNDRPEGYNEPSQPSFSVSNGMSDQPQRSMRKSAFNQRLFMKKLSRESFRGDFDYETPAEREQSLEPEEYFAEDNVWPPMLNVHTQFCWSHEFIHGRSDWILNIPPLPPDLSLYELLSRAKLPVHIDEKHLYSLCASYDVPDDNSPVMKADLKALKLNLEKMHNEMGKVNIQKIPEPQKIHDSERTSSHSCHWDDLCREMKDFQDLVLDEHREKRRKYKLIINSCQKQVETRVTNVSTEYLDCKRAHSASKQVSSIIENFWFKIERYAWGEIKIELDLKLKEKKAKRLNKFVQDAMDYATGGESEKEVGEGDSEYEGDDEEQRAEDDEFDRDMDTDEEDERQNELDLLAKEAEMDLDEVVKGYSTDSLDDQGGYPEEQPALKDKEEESDYSFSDQEQKEEDDLLDKDMETDSESERKGELDLLAKEAEMDLDELVQRYKRQRPEDATSTPSESPLSEYTNTYSSASSEAMDTDTEACPEEQTRPRHDSGLEGRSPEWDDKDIDLVPIPHLIRAKLRSYQHQGLTWLASLHEKGTNGILADEMGLGKTLQTIALLAHLACHLGKWGPHLIIVPTSLLINWEMEFKKFCPGFKILVYYGSTTERAKKRIGWNKLFLFNVCIVSYATVVQDAHILKRKNWQYMVLDEAQNIKNFQSKRWSTLLTFNSENRLLLTGTPLQNSIQELWSLMHFIMPDIFASHSEFKEWFGDPITAAIEAEQIAGTSDPSGKPSELVTKLHCVLRPYLLRRLKKDVEKQMPSKYEHVIKCTLTRRQRTLYDEFMACASTSALLKSGTYHSILSVMIQLRKICNHPDQLNPRLVESPINFGSSCIASTDLPNILNICTKPEVQVSNWLTQSQIPYRLNSEGRGMRFSDSVAGYTKFGELSNSFDRLWCRFPKYPRRSECSLQLDEWDLRSPSEVDRLMAFESFLKENLKQPEVPDFMYCADPLKYFEENKKYLFKPNYKAVIDVNKPSVPYYSGVGGISQRESVISSMLSHLDLIKSYPNSMEFLYHSQSLILPPKSSLHDDCGKFQILGPLLERLKKEGHRCLLYTQFSNMLDILEQWISFRGYIYVRFDGKTKVDQRQRIITRFNEDKKIFIFISSTRSGGLGINLTGADTVIFYDTDWNPAVDRQAMDRCHRIGQTKDVNVYRLISEYTVEENIWRKQLIKRKLDDVVVDQGKFDGEKSWMSNAATLMNMIVERKKEGDDEELYGRRILHESEALPEISNSSLKLLSMVEDEEDKLATPHKKDDKDEFKEQFSSDIFTTKPPIILLCVKFIKKYNTPYLANLINEFKLKIDAESLV